MAKKLIAYFSASGVKFLFAWTSSYGKEYMVAYLLTPFLASINNLSSAVVKTTDMTMKITYELTEETS